MSVQITDVVLRDGLQDEPVLVSTAGKCAIARTLIAAGLRELEVAAFVSAARVPQMAEPERLLAGLRLATPRPATPRPADPRPADPRPDGVRLGGIALNLRGARRAAGTGLDELRLVVSASPEHSRANANRTPRQALEEIAVAVEELAEADPELRVTGAVATAFMGQENVPVAPAQLLSVVGELRRAGIRHVHLADTLGTAAPEQVARSVAEVREAFPDLTIGLHLHDANGQALTTVDRALALGVERFDSALGGLGGCPFAPGAHGNLATEALVRHLHRRGVPTGVDAAALDEARDVLRTVLAGSVPVATGAADRS